MANESWLPACATIKAKQRSQPSHSDKSDAAPVSTFGLVERNSNDYFFEYPRRLAVLFLSDSTMSSNALGDVSSLPSEVITTVVVICLVILIIMCSYISWTLFINKDCQILKDVENGQNEEMQLRLGPLAVPTGSSSGPQELLAVDPAHQLPTQSNTAEMDATDRPAELASSVQAHQ